MEQIINYRDIPTDKRIDILNALERIGFFPAYGGVKTMQQIMEKSVPGSGPQFYFVFRENELIGYNFLIGDTKKYKAFPWLRFLYKGIIIKHNKTEPTYTKTSLFLCEKRRFFMGRTEKGGKVF